eukprot:CAMPEP_0119279394 /NCGR_PEP_ID=MMETSP1329-20130426/20725_1 /TAXON_ID=114041 /ORGANISM="Genus nov. species nov., Strain RCC1024" /LENGTH=129 /DNA_ID=CAMNT_0007279935 /DNA_START=155 /DNA_END=541 /DNA_ORIENTATION=-
MADALSLRQRMAAASCGAALTALVVTPFDVVKTRMQMAEAPGGALGKCPDCGVFVLNNGLMEHTLPKHACGAVRADGRWEAERLARALARIAKTEGAGGLYAGLAPTLAMAVPNTVLYFTAYDELRRRW